MKKTAIRSPLLVLLLLGGCGGSGEYVPPGPPTIVRFVSATPSDKKTYALTLRNEEEARSCDVPCTIQISSGTADLRMTGPVTIQTRLAIPSEPSTVTVRKRRNGQALAGYIISAIFGAAGVASLSVSNYFTEIQEPRSAMLAAGASIGLFGVSLIGDIMILTAGKNRVTLVPDRLAPRPLQLVSTSPPLVPVIPPLAGSIVSPPPPIISLPPPAPVTTSEPNRRHRSRPSPSGRRISSRDHQTTKSRQ